MKGTGIIDMGEAGCDLRYMGERAPHLAQGEHGGVGCAVEAAVDEMVDGGEADGHLEGRGRGVRERGVKGGVEEGAKERRGRGVREGQYKGEGGG